MSELKLRPSDGGIYGLLEPNDARKTSAAHSLIALLERWRADLDIRPQDQK